MLTLIPPVYFWLIVLIVCLILESITTQLVALWFVAGSIGALLAASLGAGELAQFAIFLALSFVLLALLRPLLRGALHTKQDKTNADRILEQEAVVTQAIDNRNGSGQIRLLGQVWTARSIREDVVIPQGETVVVRGISGVKAMVEPRETEKTQEESEHD